MNQKSIAAICGFALASSLLLHGEETKAPSNGPFQPEWESLKAHQDPEWFRDAKPGIYTHWGPVTVGGEDKLVPYPWLTDISLGPWYNRNLDRYRSTENLVQVFTDIVSKNGCMPRS
jgi:hypothetical protein